MSGTSDHTIEIKQICDNIFDVLPEYENNPEAFADSCAAIVMVVDIILSQLGPKVAKRYATDMNSGLLRLIRERAANEKQS